MMELPILIIELKPLIVGCLVSVFCNSVNFLFDIEDFKLLLTFSELKAEELSRRQTGWL